MLLQVLICLNYIREGDSMFFKSTKKKAVLVITLAVVLIGIATTTYYTVQINSLTKLGYTKKEAKSMTSVFSIFNIVTRHKEDLTGSISKHKDALASLGLTSTDVNKLSDNCSNLVEREKKFSETKQLRVTNLSNQIKTLETQATANKIKYDYRNETNLYKKYVYISGLLDSKYDKLIKLNAKYLLNLGYSKAEIKRLIVKDDAKTLANLKKTLARERKKLKENNGFASKSIKAQAMRMFKMTNDYRRSKGLKPFKYNYSMQSCVFKEAKAYASNKKPHNWLCTAAANENAGLSSKNSDYVKIAMDFFKSDPPHEAVLSGPYSSVAIAIVEKDGMMYMIMDVFN